MLCCPSIRKCEVSGNNFDIQGDTTFRNTNNAELFSNLAELEVKNTTPLSLRSMFDLLAVHFPSLKSFSVTGGRINIPNVGEIPNESIRLTPLHIKTLCLRDSESIILVDTISLIFSYCPDIENLRIQSDTIELPTLAEIYAHQRDKIALSSVKSMWVEVSRPISLQNLFVVISVYCPMIQTLGVTSGKVEILGVSQLRNVKEEIQVSSLREVGGSGLRSYFPREFIKFDSSVLSRYQNTSGAWRYCRNTSCGQDTR